MIGFALAVALSAAAAPVSTPATTSLGKVVRVDLALDLARQLPEDAARLGRAYPAPSAANLAIVRKAVADLRGEAGAPHDLDTLAFGSLPLSLGSFGADQSAGTIQDGRIPVANARAVLKGCTAGQPEPLGSVQGRDYLLVRIRCTSGAPEFHLVHAAFGIESGKLVQLTLNIGDLPNFVMAPAATADRK